MIVIEKIISIFPLFVFIPLDWGGLKGDTGSYDPLTPIETMVGPVYNNMEKSIYLENLFLFSKTIFRKQSLFKGNQ